MENYYSKLPKKYKSESVDYPNFNKVQIKIPFRMIIAGSSGSGKTNCLINIFNQIGAFSRVWLFARDTEEPLYRFFIDVLKEVEKESKTKVIEVYNDLSEFPDIDKEVDKEQTNLFIFDDLVLEKDQKMIEQVYIRGRKRNISSVYISQSYFGVPKVVRKNTDYIILKKINTMNDLSKIISEYQLNKTKEELQALYKESRKNFTDFLLIDLETNFEDLKYRINFGPPKDDVVTCESKQEIKIVKSAKDLKDHWNLLLAEYQAGNNSELLQNNIVMITDEMLKRKLITKKVAKEVMMLLFQNIQ